MNFLKHIKQFGRDEEGVTAIEYGLIAALVAVVLIVGATALGANLNAMFTFLAGKLSGAQAG
ncbi:Flp family type IVb pilin [Piscinibacter sp. XHJ-5]|uniref:Flp family type IVb pilin n=1 Tax=Piscinibacter sp. XHJ-5 TaxID=3037797 RepID=UPI0024532A88|nr:Flp family type IVb pilin [Piscinibacter sp. XHJ-5]